MNDTHGHYLKHNSNGAPNVGGFPSISTLIKRVREDVANEKGKLLILHAGDINIGTIKSDILNARPDIEALNHMNITAATIGSHELAIGSEKFSEQKLQAKFPFLSANLLNKKTGKFIGKPYLKLHFLKE